MSSKTNNSLSAAFGKPVHQDEEEAEGHSQAAVDDLLHPPALDSIRHWLTPNAAAVYLVCLCLSYIFFTLSCMAWLSDSHEQTYIKFREEVPKHVYERFLYVYLTLLLCDALTIVFDPMSKRTTLILLDLFIKLMATINNLMLFAGFAIVITRANGQVVVVQRYIQWAHTTPTMLVMLGYLSDASVLDLLPTILSNEVMIVTGAIAGTTVGWVSVAFSCASYAAFLPVLWGMHVMFRSIIRDTQNVSHPRDVWSLKTIYAATMVIWSTFGVIFLLGELHTVCVFTYELLMSATDFSAKCIFSNSLLLRNTRSIEIRRWAMMRAIELFGKEKVIMELQELIAQKERFMSSISHEFRTPLNGIIGLSEALMSKASGVVDPRVHHQLHIIRTSGLRLLALINDIMDAAALRRSQLFVKTEPVRIRELMADVLDLCTPLLHPGVELINSIPNDCIVLGDTGRLVQIMNNLVGNAIKFTEQGYVRATAAVAPADPKYWAISVSDTGIGIPPDKSDTIFSAFTQVDMSISRKYGGSGLGLNIVQELVKAHGGTIQVESVLGRGSTFTFMIPRYLARDSEESAVRTSRASDIIKTAANHFQRLSESSRRSKESKRIPPAATSDRQGSGGTSGPRADESPAVSVDSRAVVHPFKPFHHMVHGVWQVLSVDDDVVNQEVIEAMLRPEGFDIVRKMSGYSALAYLEQCDVFPDLILLDVMMPAMSGYTVCMSVRERFPEQGVPIIMVSAKSAEDNVVQGLHSGCDDYVIKPFNRDELKARIAVHLKDRVPAAIPPAPKPELSASSDPGEVSAAEEPSRLESDSITRIAVVDSLQLGIMSLERVMLSKMSQMELFLSIAELSENLHRFVPQVVMISISANSDVEQDVALVRQLIGNMVPLILVSDTEVESRSAAVRGLLAGADDAVQHPFRVEELMARLTSHVRRYMLKLDVRTKLGADSKYSSKTLLPKLLPKHAVEHIKSNNGGVVADSYDHMCILVCMIDEFERICMQTSVHNVVVLLNKVYHAFDMFLGPCSMLRVASSAHLYVAVSNQGLEPVPSPTHIANVLRMVSEMFESAQSIHDPTTREPIKLRVAVHLSKMIGGVIFSRVPQYWVLGSGLQLAQSLAEYCPPDTAVITSTLASFIPHNVADTVLNTGSKVITPSGVELDLHLLKVGGFRAARHFLQGGLMEVATAETTSELRITKHKLAEAQQSIRKYISMLDQARAQLNSFHMSQTVYEHLQMVMLQMSQENERLRQSQGNMALATDRSLFTQPARGAMTHRDSDRSSQPPQTSPMHPTARLKNIHSTPAFTNGNSPTHASPRPRHPLSVPTGTAVVREPRPIRTTTQGPATLPVGQDPVGAIPREPEQLVHATDSQMSSGLLYQPHHRAHEPAATPMAGATGVPLGAPRQASSQVGLDAHGQRQIDQLHQELHALQSRFNSLVDSHRCGPQSARSESVAGEPHEQESARSHKSRNKRALAQVFGSWSRKPSQ